jgi:hypothetical protein
MPGFMLHVGAGVQCMHAAPALAQSTNVRVLVGGMPAVTMADMWTVTGCPFTIPPSKPQPCVTIRWVPASRVFINGQPAVVQVLGPGQGICQSAEQAPQGTPIINMVQSRVIGM